MNAPVNYDAIWSNTWGDAQIYGPSHRIHRQILLQMTGTLGFGTVLEVGCGNGLNLNVLKHRAPGLKLVGTDISAKALSLLKAVMPEVETHSLDIAQEALPNKYDLVICFDVLEHVENDTAAIRNLAAMTGKYLLVATLQGRMREFEKSIGHVRNYAEGELTGKMKAAGLRIVQVREWGWPLYSPLYRSWLDGGGGQQRTIGRFGILKRIACEVLYGIFQFNSSSRGDMIFILAEPEAR